MPRFLPIPFKERFELSKRTRDKKEIVAPVIKVSRKAEAQYRRDLNQLVTEMVNDVRETLIPVIRRLEADFIADESPSSVIALSIRTLRQKYNDITSQAAQMSSSMIETEAEENNRKFKRNIEKATGVDLGRIIRNEFLQPVIEASLETNISLIQSIPDQYFKSLNTVIFQAVAEGDTAGSIARQIRNLTRVTRNRAELIARDQTAKVNAAITKARQEELGVTEYVWQTSEDERVRPTHRANNGKVFKWNDPPKETGHPGHDVNCRCYAAAIIKFD